MDMVRTEKLVFEYEKRDEEGNVIGTSRAIDEVDIDVKEGQLNSLLQFLVITAPESPPLPSISTPFSYRRKGPCGLEGVIPATWRNCGMCAKLLEWCFRIPTTRLLGLW